MRRFADAIRPEDARRSHDAIPHASAGHVQANPCTIDAAAAVFAADKGAVAATLHELQAMTIEDNQSR